MSPAPAPSRQRRAERLGGQMQHRCRRSQNRPARSRALASTAAVGLPPTRRCRMSMMLVSTTGNTARLPLAVGADAEAECHDDADQQRDHRRRATRDRTSARCTPRHPHVAQRPRQPQRDREHDDVDDDARRQASSGTARTTQVSTIQTDEGAAQADGAASASAPAAHKPARR